MTRALSPALVLLLAAATANAQSPQAPPPRVLSTIPSPPEGATPVPAQMSGLPLQVGDLPPGMAAIRVIRGDFQHNVPNQLVELRVGSTARVVTAVTKSDGRAQFDGLTVGDIVRVRTNIDGELLESQPFPVPPQGGVRLVLVAGVGAGIANTPPWPEASAASSVAAAGPTPAPSPGDQTAGVSSTPTLGYVVFGLVVAGVTAAVVFWPSPRNTVADPSSDRRSDLFDRLVQLEREYETGHLAADAYGVRREVLIDELLVLDRPLRRAS